MSDEGFQLGIEFESVLAAISKQIYETPLAFIRENVQNAVDAVRLQAARQGVASHDADLRVDVVVDGASCKITDNGIGMSLEDLRNLFWTIGASGKRTAEARAAGCVGMFGIGGFANFGVCDLLRVTSQVVDEEAGHWTELARTDIEAARGAIPAVRYGNSTEAAPRGTVIYGDLKDPADTAALTTYLRDFVQYATEAIYFNGELISQKPFELLSQRTTKLRAVPAKADTWTHGQVTVTGTLFETDAHTMHAEFIDLLVNGEPVRLTGWLRFENGPIDVHKRGFKLCSTTVATQIGVTGVVDCDRLAPTAGRDSLDAESSALVASIVACMERSAVDAVLSSAERIAQHTRIFRFVRLNGLVAHLGNVVVEFADGSESTLDALKRRAEAGVRVFYATSKNRALSQLLQTRGHAVVQLPADHDKQLAIREYLVSECKAVAFEGRIECAETYSEYSRFDRAFLSELEHAIVSAYDVSAVTLIPGRMTEDVPVLAVSATPESSMTVYVDVRHPEISKLEQLGITPLFTSLVAAFCREYLGEALRSRSPKFFGSGAVNLDWLAKRRSELWVLVNDDVEVLTRGTQRQVVTASDVQVVRAGPPASGEPSEPATPAPGREPKIVRIEGADEFASMFGYYLRIPDSAARAYGDVIQQCDSRGAVWAGNKIMFVASDAISTAFQFEVRLDQLIVGQGGATGSVAGGAVQLERPLQALFDGLYFPIPGELEEYLVPKDEKPIRLEVRCDWIDFTLARSWEAREEHSGS